MFHPNALESDTVLIELHYDGELLVQTEGEADLLFVASEAVPEYDHFAASVTFMASRNNDLVELETISLEDYLVQVEESFRGR